ncbi:L,D-transpeptidase family protein [Nitratireductor soli]|uniref:L,D-transpeptidase family protein n=1 Tax=Nitratireductor soli TaxID=1670619 RepID=UPI00065DFC40|nr:murein L,D-transpeptidase family protein [Nitratireductor soli]
MTRLIKYALFLSAALALAGCNETLEDISPKAERQLPASIVTAMKAKGMSKSSPVMMRIFKEEGKLEVWKAKQNGRYDMIASYDICKWSGKLGPKFTEGDRQAPEGFYTVRPAQMNPKSSYYLSFNMGFPNAYDRVNGRTGQHLMVHGACSSAGCYSMTDDQVAQIYAFARDSFKGGQRDFQIQAFPFRMTPENMARYRGDPNYGFWKMLKEGYDHFELTKVPPKVDVCEKRYVFNQSAPEGESFTPAGACPPTTQPDSLIMAYQQYQTQYDKAFSLALGASARAQPAPTIAGHKEALLVADWSKRRARGERVSREPPSLATTAVAEAPRPETPAATPSVAATASAYTASPDPQGLQRAAEAVSGQPATPVTGEAAPMTRPMTTGAIPAPSPRPEAAEAAPAPAAEQKTGSVRRRLWNLFGG